MCTCDVELIGPEHLRVGSVLLFAQFVAAQGKKKKKEKYNGGKSKKKKKMK